MDQPNHDDGNRPEDQTSSPFQKRWRRRSARFKAFVELRNLWWRLLDALEARRALRRVLYAALAALVLAGAAWLWVYPWWTRRNALSIARQWIAAGRLDYAAETVRQALADSPERPEVWRLAAEVARRRGKTLDAMDYSRHAASLAPDNTTFTLEWADDALLAERLDIAEKALAGLPAQVMAGSSLAQRIAGEIARRRILLTLAQSHFEAALHLDGPVAIDEVPLGAILIYARDPVARQRGLGLLAKWTADREWGAAALRPLLGDAMDHDDRPAMLKWAEALRAHPRCSLADIPNCLLAISRADEAHFAAVLVILEKAGAATPSQAAQLIGWLNQIGRSAEAVRWLQTLPPDVTKKAPVVVVAAEALRRTSDWAALNAWVTEDEWGRDVEFLRLAYGMEATRQLGDNARADEFWRTLQGDAQTNGPHALFVPAGRGPDPPVGRRGQAGRRARGARHAGAALPDAARRGGPVPRFPPPPYAARAGRFDRQQFRLLRRGDRERLRVGRGHRPRKPCALSRQRGLPVDLRIRPHHAKPGGRSPGPAQTPGRRLAEIAGRGLRLRPGPRRFRTEGRGPAAAGIDQCLDTHDPRSGADRGRIKVSRPTPGTGSV